MRGLWGGLLLLLGGGLLGWSVTAEMGRRCRAVGALREGLYQMERELTLHLTPLPTLLQGETLPFSQHFARCGVEIGAGESVAASWDRLVESLPHLGQEEGALLRPLGHILGQFEGEVQSEALLRTARVLEEREHRLREERCRLGRVYPAVGATAGAFLAIVLG